MEKQPEFLRDFSKEHSQSERDKTAQKIRGERAGAFHLKRMVEIHDRELRAGAISNTDKLEEQNSEIERLSAEIDASNDSGLKSIWNYFKTRRKELELVDVKQNHRITMDERMELNGIHVFLQKDRAEISGRFENARKMLADFYEEQKKKMEGEGSRK